MGTKTLIEYVYVSKMACNCRVWEFWAILFVKVGMSCRRHLYTESLPTLIYINTGFTGKPNARSLEPATFMYKYSKISEGPRDITVSFLK